MNPFWIRHRGIRLLAIAPFGMASVIVLGMGFHVCCGARSELFEAYHEAVHEAVQNRHWGAADLWLRRAEQLGDLNEWLQIARVCVAQQHGKPHLAVQRARESIERSAQPSPVLHLWLASQLLPRTVPEWAKANETAIAAIVDHLESAAADDRIAIAALVKLARLHEARHEWDRARLAWERLSEHHPAAHLELARLQEHGGRNTQARLHWQQAYRWLTDLSVRIADPDDKRILAARALCERRLDPDQPSLSLQILGQLEQTRGSTNSLLLKAEEYFQSGYHTRALETLQRLLERRVVSPAVANNAAWLIAESTDRVDQLQWARELSSWAVRSNPHVADYLETYGRIQLRLGNLTEAVAMLEEAVQQNPHSPIARLWLEDARRALGKNQDQWPW